MKRIIYFLFLFVYGCANMIAPSGGLKDESPPNLTKVSPSNYQKNSQLKSIAFIFDENIAENNLKQKIFSSPPLEKITHKINGNKLELFLEYDKFKEATYHLNFNSGIKDINEGNITSELDYVFSTYNTIDTLSFSGRVVDAFSGLNTENVWLLLYETTINDTLVFDKKPFYISKSDSIGDFSFNNLKNLDYNLFALNGNDLQYSAGEKIGFKKKPISSLKNNSTIYLFDPYFNFDSIKIENNLKIDSVSKTGNLLINLKKAEPVIILLYKNDEVMYLRSFNDSICRINNISTGEYSVKIIIDTNNNQKWDNGNFKKKENPEKSYIYNEKINIRENWDLNIDCEINGD
tara:strand:- start:12020 stop:13063 length:1044 start_codon:yes stop_codon:yes gene_type:complete